jgi:hypothetical protein
VFGSGKLFETWAPQRVKVAEIAEEVVRENKAKINQNHVDCGYSDRRPFALEANMGRKSILPTLPLIEELRLKVR